MKVPTHLGHKPIIAVENYEAKDGIYANNSDAKALSIGQAQYDKNEISGKVFRKPKKRWSPQSEELPIHRIFDLSILVVAAFMRKPDTPPHPLTSLWEKVIEEDRANEIQEYYKKQA